MWHEFQHYKRHVEFREPESTKTAETKELETELNDTSLKEKPNAEIEATSIELADNFDKLSDDEVKNVLRYLSDFMVHTRATNTFKTPAIERIRASVTGDRKKQDRMLNLLKNDGRKADVAKLKDIADAITKDLAPAPKKKKGK
jgi:hypothetical protein